MDAIPQKLWVLLWSLALLITLYCLIQINTRHAKYAVKYRLVWSLGVFLPFLAPLL